MAFEEKRPPWRSSNNKRNFQRELAEQVVKPYGYPENRLISERVTAMRDMPHVRHRNGQVSAIVAVMNMAVQLGWSYDQVLSFEARARALDAGERYFSATSTHPTEDMLQAFEAIWVSGEFFIAYDFFATHKKATIKASTRRI